MPFPQPHRYVPVNDMEPTPHRARTRILPLALLMIAMALLGGCAGVFSSYGDRSGHSSSVVDFLYPKGTPFEPVEPGTPRIPLPARVGLMFVPSSSSPPGLTVADREQLLEKVRHAFREQDFIERIEIVPDSYLRRGGGFDNLEQIARMHGLDLVALVSYDQLSQRNETGASFLYWTIIGAYTIPATRNQVSTFVETTVFDIRSHALLLRAPGQDQRDLQSTGVRSDERRETLARASFNAAVDDMIPKLDSAIREFAMRAGEDGRAELYDRRSGDAWRGKSGGGSIGTWELALLLGALALMLASRRR